MKVLIYQPPARLGHDLFIIDEQQGVRSLMRIKDGEPIFEKMDEGLERPKPTISLPHGVLEQIVEQAKKDGVRTESDSVMEGKLAATSFHLEDLRTLLKLKK